MSGITAWFTGRLSFDPERRYSPSGKEILQFVASVDGERLQAGAYPTTVRVTAWEALAAELADQLEKGSSVYCEGTLALGRWTGRDGAPRSGLNLSAQRVEVLGAVGRRTSTGPAPSQHQAGMMRRPSADHGASIGRPADDEPPLSAYGEPASDDLPIDFDEPRTPRPIRQRIAEAAGQGQQRAATRRPWGR